MNHIVCYTCITGSYDTLKQPLVVSKGVDYVCFTDSMQPQFSTWQLRPMPEELRNLSNVKKQRVVKICPHKYLNSYDVSVWVDGSFQIVGDIKHFIEQYDLEKVSLYTRVHPYRKCIYEEAKACIGLRRDSQDVIEHQIKRYKAEGYPQNAGVAETGIILRKHNDRICKLLMNLWASELLKGSHRDQLSFNYACWKMHFLPGCLNNEFKISNSTFKFYMHGSF